MQTTPLQWKTLPGDFIFLGAKNARWAKAQNAYLCGLIGLTQKTDPALPGNGRTGEMLWQS
jgi:hypothetical protein